MSNHTIGSGTTITAGYTIASGIGAGFTLSNFGVVGATTTGTGVLVSPSGDVVTNASGGKILASSTGNGIRLSGGGYVHNLAGGTISGGMGVYAPSGQSGATASTVTNQGSIAGVHNTSGSFGVRLNVGGFLTNLPGGSISGAYGGVYVGGAVGNVANQYSISGGVAGVFMRAGGYLLNDTAGKIIANYAVAFSGGTATVKNGGQILGSAKGVEIANGGTVVNFRGATITGAQAVPISGGVGVLYNQGVINAGATGTAASFGAGYANRLVLYPGASFTGTINGGNTLGATTISTIRLGTSVSGGAAIGTLTGIGSKYINFAGITISPGASWVLGAGSFGALGPNAYAATINDSGTLTNYATLRSPVTLRTGGRVTNGTGGTIISELFGIDGRSIAATVLNDGLIQVQRAGGIAIEGNGGTVTNQAFGTLEGGLAGVLMLSNGLATVVNLGLLEANTYTTPPLSHPFAVILQSGGLVNNQGGKIVGYGGVSIAGAAGTVINSGTISGAGDKAVKFAAGFANQLSIIAGATFTGGIVDGANAPGSSVVSSLVLAAGGSNGTVNGLGTEYINFGTLTVAANANWTLTSATFQSGMAIVDNGTLTNYGVANYGATLGGNGVLKNGTSGRITGRTIATIAPAVYAPTSSAAVTVQNDGYLGGGLVEAVRLKGGGTVTNTANGYIHGLYGVVISGQTGSVTNSGRITGSTGGPLGIGVRLKSGGTLNNLAGTIGGALYGVYAGNNYVAAGPAFIVNKGTISGGQTGVIITNSGLNSGGTVTNFGVIKGGTSGFALRFRPGSGDELDIVPGAVFSGLVYGGNTIGATNTSLLRLNSAAASGTLTGGSAVYEAFGAIAVDAGATWTFAAGGTIATGTTLTDNGTLSNLGTLSGQITLAGTSSLTNASGALISPLGVGAASALNVKAGAKSTIINLGLIESASLHGPGLFSAGNLVSITNSGTGVIAGYVAIYVTNGDASIVNSGTIHGAGTFGDGVGFNPGPTNTNTLTVVNSLGHIDGYVGVRSNARESSIVNSGTILGHETSGAGVYFYHGATGLITNQTSGFIGGQVGVLIKTTTILVENDSGARIGDVTSRYGAYLYGGSAAGDVQLTNLGSIAGYKAGIVGVSVAETLTNNGIVGVSATQSQYGVRLAGNNDLVTNNFGYVIIGETAIADLSFGITLFNRGTVSGNTTAGIGILLRSGGYVSNARAGTISGLRGIVAYNQGATTVRNAGLIKGGVTIQAGAANLVSIAPGSSIVGVVDGGNTAQAAVVSTLELGGAVPAGEGYTAGPGIGTLAGFGSKYVDFSRVIVDSGAIWSIAGQDSLSAGGSLTNNGSLSVNGQVLVDGEISAGTSLLTIGQSNDASLTVENGGTVKTDGAGLDIAPAAGIGAEIVVTGTRSLLNVQGGEFLVGDSEAGHLRIQAGGSVVANVSDAVIGGGGDGSSAELTGAGSDWQITGALSVGQEAAGALSVGAGSTVTATGFIAVGQFNSQGSSVDVVGNGASLQSGELLDVGVFGSGVLSIGNGATVTASFFTVGDSAAAAGQANLTGAGSSLIVTNDAVIANDGAGVLSVLNGATLSAATLTIGAQGDSSGAVVVSGAGSAINVSGALNVGTALGTGDLTVGPGAAVHAGVLNLRGQVVLEGGLLDPTVSLITQGQTTAGFGTIAAGEIVDEGVIQAGGGNQLLVDGVVSGGGTLSINGTMLPLSGAAVLRIDAGATMELTGAVLNGTTTFTDDAATPNTYTVANSVVDVTFADTSRGMLLLDDIAGFAGTITAFSADDQIVISGGTLSDMQVVNHDTLTFSDSGPNAAAGGVDSVIFGFSVDPQVRRIFSIANGNTVVVSCFAAGTRVLAETGLVAVEELAVGDRVVTVDPAGETGGEPIVWIGRRVVDCARHPDPTSVWPVCVSAGAFGRNVPERDLFLSPDHAVFVAGVLVPVKLLVNGTSIVRTRWQRVTYYHVELPAHAVILAEGLAVESYLDMDDRGNFDTADGAVRLFPDFGTRLAPAAALAWETRGAAPLALAGERLERARAIVRGDEKGFRRRG